MQKANRKKQKSVPKSKLLKFAVCIFTVYAVFTLVQQQMDIRERRAELDFLQQQVEEMRLKNKDIERLLESDGTEYAERIARDEYGYAYPDEKVYIDTSGD